MTSYVRPIWNTQMPGRSNDAFCIKQQIVIAFEISKASLLTMVSLDLFCRIGSGPARSTPARFIQ